MSTISLGVFDGRTSHFGRVLGLSSIQRFAAAVTWDQSNVSAT
jgi:hypothetical protein